MAFTLPSLLPSIATAWQTTVQDKPSASLISKIAQTAASSPV